MHLATYATTLAPGKVSKPPWINDALVNCSEDTSHEVPPDVALLANGKISIRLYELI
jgi:hypothetical protein